MYGPDVLIVVENKVYTLNNDIYVAQVDDAEVDGSSFEDAVVTEAVENGWNLEQIGSVQIPIYRVTRKA